MSLSGTVTRLFVLPQKTRRAVADAGRFCIALHCGARQSQDDPMQGDRDVEKGYPTSEFVAKLRRLADAIESGEKFEIQIAGERIYVPVRAVYNIEHEREGGEEEIEFQIKWKNA